MSTYSQTWAWIAGACVRFHWTAPLHWLYRERDRLASEMAAADAAYTAAVKARLPDAGFKMAALRVKLSAARLSEVRQAIWGATADI